MNDIKGTQQAVNKICRRLWRSLDNIMELFEMDIMEDIKEATPAELNIEYVERRRDLSKNTIEAIEELCKEAL
jgi:hypothetical protein